MKVINYPISVQIPQPGQQSCRDFYIADASNGLETNTIRLLREPILEGISIEQIKDAFLNASSGLDVDKRFREMIRSSGISQNKIGKLSGVDHSQISRYMKGERTMTATSLFKVIVSLMEVNNKANSNHECSYRFDVVRALALHNVVIKRPVLKGVSIEQITDAFLNASSGSDLDQMFRTIVDFSGVSHSEIDRLSGVDHSQISRYVKGERNMTAVNLFEIIVSLIKVNQGDQRSYGMDSFSI